MDIKPVYTLEEVQEILGISRPIALMMIREKKLIIHQLGMKRFVLLEDLVDYIGQLPRAFVSEAMSVRTTKANIARKENAGRTLSVFWTQMISSWYRRRAKLKPE